MGGSSSPLDTLVTLITLCHSVYTNVYNVASFMDEGQTPLSQTVFASHDYTLTEASSIKVQQAGFALMLMVEGKRLWVGPPRVTSLL